MKIRFIDRLKFIIATWRLTGQLSLREFERLLEIQIKFMEEVRDHLR